MELMTPLRALCRVDHLVPPYGVRGDQLLREIEIVTGLIFIVRVQVALVAAGESLQRRLR
jgi:hypothetical protein